MDLFLGLLLSTASSDAGVLVLVLCQSEACFSWFFVRRASEQALYQTVFRPPLSLHLLHHPLTVNTRKGLASSLERGYCLHVQWELTWKCPGPPGFGSFSVGLESETWPAHNNPFAQYERQGWASDRVSHHEELGRRAWTLSGSGGVEGHAVSGCAGLWKRQGTRLI